MKLQSKLTLIGSVAALATSPLALANKEGAAKPEATEVQDAEPEVIICEEGPDSGEVVVDEPSDVEEGTDEPTDETVIDDTVVDVEDGGSDGEVTTTGEEGEGIPLDWVKRGGGDNPEIFQNMAGGEAPVFKGETAGKELGQDEKATAIEAQDAPVVSQVNREKKVPVALIKKGRVFLR
ncbi:MAG: hypothetical protein V4689_03695 [Verrucomicrobiota bacterium]